jgi:hypothetical protein
MKHDKLKHETNSYTWRIIPWGGALINGRSLILIGIPLLNSQLRGASRTSRPSTTTMLGKGTMAARVSQPIGCIPGIAETEINNVEIVDLSFSTATSVPAPPLIEGCGPILTQDVPLRARRDVGYPPVQRRYAVPEDDGVNQTAPKINHDQRHSSREGGGSTRGRERSPCPSPCLRDVGDSSGGIVEGKRNKGEPRWYVSKTNYGERRNSFSSISSFPATDIHCQF